jgi:nitrate reductase beta subunit
LAGVCETGGEDVNFKNLDYSIYLTFKNVFLLYLPRLCEHCLNPACVASCPSGALYKREEDGIVLVDQERCRGWRYCVSGCPYKKVYFNWHTGRSEKCIFCYPRIEAGMPTLCAQTCVGRIRYIGVLLYDADKIGGVAAIEDIKDVYPAHLDMLLDPADPKVIESAKKQGIVDNVIEAARHSPVYRLAKSWKLALPLHPEYRTLPMVWYIPPLSPIAEHAPSTDLLTMIDSLRIPVTYLANLLSAGDEEPVRLALKRLAAVRQYMRSLRVEQTTDHAVLDSVGLSVEAMQDMYRLLALAKYDERFVIPTLSRTDGAHFYAGQGCSGFEYSSIKSG